MSNRIRITLKQVTRWVCTCGAINPDNTRTCLRCES